MFEFAGQDICTACEGTGRWFRDRSPCTHCGGTGDGPPCTCDRDTLMDGMATPGCPTHAPALTEEDA